jgi:putative phosphoesterase
MPITLGIISDTHGLLRDAVAPLLAGVARILHAGDVGNPEILETLARIAPLEAVRGNIDVQPWARSLPLTRIVEIGGVRLFLLHDLAQLDFDPAARGFHAVITGHSHRARQERRDGVLYLNPGSAGPRRFRLPVTLARLVIDGGRLEPEILALPV